MRNSSVANEVAITLVLFAIGTMVGFAISLLLETPKDYSILNGFTCAGMFVYGRIMEYW